MSALDITPISTLPLAHIPRRGSAFWRWFGRTFYGGRGWRLAGAMPDLPKMIIAVAPHTSNWDFFIAASAMFQEDIRLTFLGKHSLFVGPLNRILRWMGGVPVNRSAPQGVVGDAVAAFNARSQMILALAPEGTRKPVKQFRTGFLQIARQANVPVLLAGFDYPRKMIHFGPLIQASGDIEADRIAIEAHFKQFTGKRPLRDAYGLSST